MDRLALGAGEAMGHAVIMRSNLDMIINADAADAPFAELVGLGGQGLQRAAIYISSN